MKSVTPKTIEEHGYYLTELVRLKLWFAHSWLAHHPEENLQTVLRTRVDIFRKTDINAGLSKNTIEAGDFSLPAWLALEEKLEVAYQRCAAESSETFEEEAWAILRETVLARTERDFNEGDGLDNFNCGSLRYNLKPQGTPPRVGFHIGNRIAPNSIFDDPHYLPDCFRQLMDESSKRYGAEALTTSSWLNSYPGWIALFPQEWQNNLSEPDPNIGWSQGHWGQFVNARGTFNRKHGAIMRETGELPFKPRSSWCSFTAMRNHLMSLA